MRYVCLLDKDRVNRSALTVKLYSISDLKNSACTN